MFAVIKTGGKQYKVAEGDEIIIEKLAVEAGKNVTFEDVLMLGDGKTVTVGEPMVSGASVVGTVSEHRKGDKVLIMKKRQRNTYRRKKGHRQHEMVVTIDSILADGKKRQLRRLLLRRPRQRQQMLLKQKPKQKRLRRPLLKRLPLKQSLMI